jgi:hypothetical protein
MPLRACIASAQNHQDPRQLPDRRGGVEIAVSGDPQCPEFTDADRLNK